MIKAVIIGFAHMHVNEIAKYIGEESQLDLIGIADVPPMTPENTYARYTRRWNLKNNSELFKLQPYDNYTEMLDTLKPDIAFVLCENAFKSEIALECAKRHINVCIEKPMSITYNEALKIRETAENYGIEIIINWPVIWRPYIHRQLAALNSGMVGDLIKVFYINGHTGPLGKGAKHRGVSETAQEMTDDARATTWWYQEKTGGGTFLDIGCYGCFFNTWARKDDDTPISVFAHAGNYNTPYMNAADNIAAIIEYKTSMGIFEGTWTTPQASLPTGPVYCCTNGVLYCTESKNVVAMNLYGEVIPMPEFEIAAHIKNIADHYAYCKENDLPLIKTVSMDWNLKVMALLDTAIKSSKTGKKELVPCVK